ncbi:hypothetical protein PMAYCL1PPCAC_09894, partial [Pristionchus mayeri]
TGKDHVAKIITKHIYRCVRTYLRSRDQAAVKDESLIEEILAELRFVPASDPVFSTSGCKGLERKTDVAVAEWKAKKTFVRSGKS